jgi:hypothetical protein
MKQVLLSQIRHRGHLQSHIPSSTYHPLMHTRSQMLVILRALFSAREMRYLDLRGAKVGPALDGRPLDQQVILKHVVFNCLKRKKEKIELN